MPRKVLGRYCGENELNLILEINKLLKTVEFCIMQLNTETF